MTKNIITYEVLHSWAESYCNSSRCEVTASLSAEGSYAKEVDGPAVLELETRNNERVEIWIGAADEKGSHSLVADDGRGASFTYTSGSGPEALCAELNRIAARMLTERDVAMAA
jgi:hypothetical protein